MDRTVFYLIRWGYYFVNTRILTEWVAILAGAGFVVCATGLKIYRGGGYARMKGNG